MKSKSDRCGRIPLHFTFTNDAAMDKKGKRRKESVDADEPRTKLNFWKSIIREEAVAEI